MPIWQDNRLGVFSPDEFLNAFITAIQTLLRARDASIVGKKQREAEKEAGGGAAAAAANLL